MSAQSKSVLLLGATGLVGGECLKRLSADPAFHCIVVLTRGDMSASPSDRVEHHRINFDDPATSAAYLNVDAVICALGTTIKKAGSQPAFRRVDFEYPLMFAKLARQAGAKHYLLVSSSGANPKSRIFYTRVKGELETAISSLDYPAVTIFRPSLLLGQRSEHRRGEAIAQQVMGMLKFALPKDARPIEAARVAEAIVSAAKSDSTGVRIVSNAEMI